MDTLLIHGNMGGVSLEFSRRNLVDPASRVDCFFVRIISLELTAEARIMHPRTSPMPDQLFAEMARQWAGWSGELTWESLEHDLALRCTRDRFGHVTIRVELGSDPLEERGWTLRIPIVVEAGQLEGLARRAQKYFGSS
jgi:hypothetical protein